MRSPERVDYPDLDDVDRPGPRSVALDEEDRLPGPEVEGTVDDREGLTRTEEERPEVRIRSS